MVILGIDPGVATTGFGIINFSNGKAQILNYGIIETPKSLKFAERLTLQKKKLEALIRKHSIDLAAVEKLYFMKNIKTGIDVAQARGVILETLNSQKIAFNEFDPTQIKLALVGYGRAQKSQVQKMVQQILNLEELPKPDDAADALAVAICCAHNLAA
jgi:crossover junction endodeoxyribonuclease RuvC